MQRYCGTSLIWTPTRQPSRKKKVTKVDGACMLMNFELSFLPDCGTPHLKRKCRVITLEKNDSYVSEISFRFVFYCKVYHIITVYDAGVNSSLRYRQFLSYGHPWSHTTWTRREVPL